MAEQVTPPINNYCNVCKCMLSEGDKNVQAHNVGKRHQLALHNSHMDNIKTKTSVFVTGFNSKNVTKDGLKIFFNSFGEIKDIFVGDKKNFVIIQFTDPEVVKTLLKGGIYYEGSQLSIKPRILKATPAPTQEETKIQTDFEKLIKNLKDIRDFDLQIKKILQAINYYDPNKHMKYRQVVDDLRDALNQQFQCNIYPFGSTITGLDFIGSDVDVFVEANPRFREDSREELREETRAQSFVIKSRNLLRKHSKFSHIIAVPRAKTPICKCRHIPTNINCDFNFKSMLGLCNSYLIRHYLSIDTKLLKTMIILKTWGKIHQIIGAQCRFSPYTLTMMFIFYLQQTPINLPPVYILQLHHEYNNIQEHWNGGFDSQTPLPTQNVYAISIHHLLFGFFDYYAKFDYNLKIICPFFGVPVLKTEFNTPETLPDEYFRLYKYNVINLKMEPIRFDTPICIQDPFEQNHNTSKAVSSRTLIEFVEFCKQASDICNPTRDAPSLYRLLNEEIDLNHVKITQNQCDFKCLMGGKLAYFKCADDKELKQLWFDSMCEFVLTVLKSILKFTIHDPKPVSVNNKAIKLDGQSDVHDSINSITYHCTGTQNYWEARKSIGRNLPYDSKVKQTFLEREIDLTNYIADVLCEGIVLTQVIINLNISLTPNSTGMEISVVKNAASNVFESFSTYFANRLPILIDSHEKQKLFEFKQELTANSNEITNEVPSPPTNNV